MVCYVPGTGTLAVLGFAVYLVWHRAIMHFLSMVGIAMEVTLLLSAEVAVAIFLIWTARMIRRRRAAAGACTTCRFRCQEAMAPRPNFFVNRVDRRVGPPPRSPARPDLPPGRADPALPALPALPGRAPCAGPACGRPVGCPRTRPAQCRASRPAPGPGPQLAPPPAAQLAPPAQLAPRLSWPQPAQLAPRPAAQLAPHPVSWRRAPLLNWRRTPLLNWQGIPLHGSRHALTRPAVAPLAPGAPARPWPAAAAADQWSLTPGETVTFDGYVLTPDGVDAPPDPVRDPHS